MRPIRGCGLYAGAAYTRVNGIFKYSLKTPRLLGAQHLIEKIRQAKMQNTTVNEIHLDEQLFVISSTLIDQVLQTVFTRLGESHLRTVTSTLIKSPKLSYFPTC